MPVQANEPPESPEEKHEPAAVSEQIDFSKIPEGTVTIIVKNKDGKVFTTGLTLPDISKDTPEEDMVMALQRVKDVNTRVLNTVYYEFGERPKTQDIPELQ